jgi:hypothetical protein
MSARVDQMHPAHAMAPGIYEKLNSQWHKHALRIFMLIVLAHWAEHLTQAAQIYILGWPVPESRGVLGLWFPWLIKSELLHYGYALIMLAGLWIFRSGFQGQSRKWWTLALVIQFWHHFEHALLQGQALVGQNLMGSPVPISIAQVWFPRVELHLFYNSIVFIPMVLGMYYHMFPSKEEGMRPACTCRWREARA